MSKSFGQKTWDSFKFWLGKIWSLTKLVTPKLFGPFLVVAVIIIAVILVSMGFKNLQIGGLLAKLLGKKDPANVNTIDIANSIDPNRVDPNGKIIPIGQPDSNGDTQAVVVPIQDPGLFSDPKKVVFTEPGKESPTTITLPDGVTNKDLDQVIVVKPSVVVVTVKDSSNISTQTVDDLLRKYSK